MKLLVILNLLLTFFTLHCLTEKASNDSLRKVQDMSRLSLYSSYCNNYQRRALQHFVRTKNWDGYVLMSPVCEIQNALDVEFSLKYKNWKPNNPDFILYSYDSYYTGLGSSGGLLERQYQKLLKKIISRVYKIQGERK